MEIRINPSSPNFPTIYAIVECIAQLKNPQLFWNLKDMPEAERKAEISWLENLFEELSH